MEMGDEAAPDPLDQLLQQLDVAESAQHWDIPAIGSLAVVASPPMAARLPRVRIHHPMLGGDVRAAGLGSAPDPISPPSYKQQHLDWLLASGDISPSAMCPTHQAGGSSTTKRPQNGALAFIDIDNKPTFVPDLEGPGTSLPLITSNLSGE
jgi:hypothetical protein